MTQNGLVTANGLDAMLKANAGAFLHALIKLTTCSIGNHLSTYFDNLAQSYSSFWFGFDANQGTVMYALAHNALNCALLSPICISNNWKIISTIIAFINAMRIENGHKPERFISYAHAARNQQKENNKWLANAFGMPLFGNSIKPAQLLVAIRFAYINGSQ